VLDTPGELPGSAVGRGVCQGAYPVHVHDGLVFAYLGPPEARPPFPVYDTARAGADAVPFSLEMPCHWLQVFENTQDPVHVVYLHTRMSGQQFGDASGATQAIAYRPTPLGMVNVQTRHWGGHFWTRCTETILPNCNQGGAVWEAADARKVFRRAAFTRWMVPVDDARTRVIGWRYFSDALDPAGLGDRSKVGKQSIDFVGQTEEERSYAERQRRPGDYEVLVSQRPVAVHALEHLGTSDQGVTALRALIRAGIRRVAAGGGLDPYPVGPDGLVPTYVQDTVWPMPGLAPGSADRATLAAFGKLVAEALLADPLRPPAEREAAIARALAAAHPPG
jgi:hypothetical protein